MKKIVLFLLLLSVTSAWASEIRCAGGNYVISISKAPALTIELQDNDSGTDKEFSRKNINVKRGFVTKYGLTSSYGSYYEIVLDDLSSDNILSGHILKIDGRKKIKTKITCY